MGFSYDQLGDVSKNLESFVAHGPEQRQDTKQLGILTHNSFDYSKIVSSDGLGVGNPVIKNGTPMQNYRLQSYFTGTNLPNNLGLSGNYIHLLSDSKPINAEALPSLNNGNNYLVIESDIVKTNAKDSNSNSTTIVGIMSKENATNDTIFSVNPVTFINTEPRLLSTIEVQIKNPDGTLVSDNVVGKNNGFVFQIEKAIKVADIASQSF